MRTCTCMSSQFTTHTYIPFTSFQIVNGANVIQATAGHIVARRGICTCHDPRGTQRDGMNLNDKTHVMQARSRSKTLTTDIYDPASSLQLSLHSKTVAKIILKIFYMCGQSDKIII